MKFKEYLNEEEITIIKNKWDAYVDSLKSANISYKWKQRKENEIIIIVSNKDKKKAIKIAKAVKAI